MVMDLMLGHTVGAVVIVDMQEKESPESESADMLPMPAGIITKSDILKAYHDRVDIDAPCKSIMGERSLVTCTPNDNRDNVASLLEKNKTHHVIVVDEDHAHFVGIVSSWDVAAECAKDNRAWPYLRSEDGKIPYPPTKIEKEPLPDSFDPEKPTTVVNHKHFSTYMDDLDLEAFQ